MTKKISFTKMVASGNDFVVVDNFTGRKRISAPIAGRRFCAFPLAVKICDRKYGVGADGVLLLEKSRRAAVRMRVFNADGSEAEMCGNGARCAAFYVNPAVSDSARGIPLSIETKAGIIEAGVINNKVKIKLTEPKNIKLNIPLKLNNRPLKVHFINTGVPHTVVFVEGLDKIDIVSIGRQVRGHRQFKPAGTNVDFVEFLNDDSIRLRTYERGVEDETLACGTGSAASALLSAVCYPLSVKGRINVHTQSGEILRVYFDRSDNSFSNVWLEGGTRIVHKGEYYV